MILSSLFLFWNSILLLEWIAFVQIPDVALWYDIQSADLFNLTAHWVRCCSLNSAGFQLLALDIGACPQYFTSQKPLLGQEQQLLLELDIHRAFLFNDTSKTVFNLPTVRSVKLKGKKNWSTVYFSLRCIFPQLWLFIYLFIFAKWGIIITNWAWNFFT